MELADRLRETAERLPVAPPGDPAATFRRGRQRRQRRHAGIAAAAAVGIIAIAFVAGPPGLPTGGPGDLEVADQPGVSEPAPDEEPEPEAEVDPVLSEVVLPYLDALGASSSSERAVALALAAEGSPAAWYASFTDGWYEAFSPGGDGLPPTTNTVLPDGEVRSCWEYADTDLCSVYGAFTVEADKVVSFELDGQPIRSRMAVVPDEVFPIAGGAALTPVAATLIREPAGVHVIFSVTAGDTAVNVAIRRSTYQPPGGDRTMTQFGMGPDMVEAGTTVSYGAQFTDVEPGGTFVLEGWTDTSPSRQTWEVTLPILPPG